MTSERSERPDTEPKILRRYPVEARIATAVEDERRIALCFVAPSREKCGISDYSKHLLHAILRLPQIELADLIPLVGDAVRPDLRAVLGAYAADRKGFQKLGRRASLDGISVCHLQHQYFVFGGVAPYRTHIRAFLDAVRAPLVMTVHEIVAPADGGSAARRAALALANRMNFVHPVIRRFIVHTNADRDALAGIGAPRNRIHVIPLAVPEPLSLPDAVSAKAELGLAGRRVVTLFGFLAKKKGHRLAIQALRLLPDDVVLLFAGDRHPDDLTDYVSGLREEIASSGLADRILITGYIPEPRLPIVLAATDVALAPYAQASGSAALSLALAAARPIVASDIPPFRDIASEKQAPLVLFPSGDGAALAERVASLIDDEPRRAGLQAAARLYAERHSYDAVAREHLAVYRAAL